jgi:hypothetical protein
MEVLLRAHAFVRVISSPRLAKRLRKTSPLKSTEFGQAAAGGHQLASIPAKNWVPFAKKPLLRQNNPVFPDASVDDLGERLVASQRGSQLTRMTKRSHFDLV